MHGGIIGARFEIFNLLWWMRHDYIVKAFALIKSNFCNSVFDKILRKQFNYVCCYDYFSMPTWSQNLDLNGLTLEIPHSEAETNPKWPNISADCLSAFQSSADPSSCHVLFFHLQTPVQYFCGRTDSALHLWRQKAIQLEDSAKRLQLLLQWFTL